MEGGDSCSWAIGFGSQYVGTAIFTGVLADFFSKKYRY